MTRRKLNREGSGYSEFLSGSEVVPEGLHERVRAELEARMKPSFFRILFSILKAQIILGALTLLVCPQFGIGPLGGGDGLMGWVESYGHLICGTYCGSIFVGLNVLYARFFLPLDDRNAIRSEPMLPFGVLGVISFSLIVMVSLMWNGIVPHLHAEFVGGWLFAFLWIPLVGLRLGFRGRVSE
ncbi:MAG: hypothetical protein KGP28_00845 [Bdellovibrionales bacterium]|nr:hypothetical protein [Bdellovibrionales bacterium]